MKTILVTGGTGFIGNCFCKLLLEERPEYRVINVDVCTYAKDYVECMWLIMQQDTPDDFVIATGVQHTVRDFTEKTFAANGVTIRWEGEGLEEKGYDASTGKMLVCVNPKWYRPTDVDNLWGDPTKAKTVLGWNPQSTTYEELVCIMATHDRELAMREKMLKGN